MDRVPVGVALLRPARQDDPLRMLYDVANAVYIGDDPAVSLRSDHDSMALLHVSHMGTDAWGHDPIGTGAIDFRAVGSAAAATVGAHNAVREVIRAEDTLQEFEKALRALRKEGWNV
jgi:L-ribulose-5-phosphate 3-epimerase